MTSRHRRLTVRPAGPPGAPVALPHAAGQVTTGAAPCASETGAASGRCATFKQGALSHGRHSAFRAKRPGAARSVVCLSSSPRPLAGRAGLLGSRHRPAGGSWSKAQAGRTPHTSPRPLRTGQFPCCPGQGTLPLAQSWAECSRAKCPSALLFLRPFLTLSLLKDSL